MGQERDALNNEVKSQTNVKEAVIRLVNGILSRLTVAGTDPAKLAVLKEDLSNPESYAAAVIKNTPEGGETSFDRVAPQVERDKHPTDERATQTFLDGTPTPTPGPRTPRRGADAEEVKAFISESDRAQSVEAKRAQGQEETHPAVEHPLTQAYDGTYHPPVKSRKS